MFHEIKEKTSNLSCREKILIAVLIGCIFVSMVLYVLIPQIEDYRYLYKQAVLNQQKIISINKQIAACTSNDMKKNNVKWQGYKKYFSREINDGTVLAIIGSISEIYDLQLLSFKPQEPVEKLYHNELPVDFIVMGDWLQIIKFIDQLEQQQIITEIRYINIVVPSDGKAKAQLSLVTYYEKKIM